MIDTVIYSATQYDPAGPIIRPAEPLPHELYADDNIREPLTMGQTIGGIISAGLLVAVGAYLALAL